jgi:hypothetical protein
MLISHLATQGRKMFPNSDKGIAPPVKSHLQAERGLRCPQKSLTLVFLPWVNHPELLE